MSPLRDYSHWVAKPVREIVRTVACTACGARAGRPCYNKMFEIKGAPERHERTKNGRKKRRHMYYLRYVHAARRKAMPSTLLTRPAR